MASPLLPKACLNFSKNKAKLRKTWQSLLENLEKQIYLLNSLKTFEKIELLIQKEGEIFKEVLFLYEFLKNSAEDLLKRTYLSLGEIKNWEKEQRALSERYLAKKSLINPLLRELEANLQFQRAENKKKRIARPAGETYTKASILDISL